MITSAWFISISFLISGICKILPIWVFPVQLTSALQLFFSSADSINFIFPIYDLLYVAGFLITFETVLFATRLVSKLIFKDRVDI